MPAYPECIESPDRHAGPLAAASKRNFGKADTTDLALTAIKGLAIIGVVIHHLVNRRFDAETNQILGVLRECFSWCVFAFIAVSGSLNARAEEKRSKTLYEFGKSRISRLLVPFIILILFYSLIWQGIQAFSGIGLRGSLAPDYFGKVAASVWPGGGEVAEQLYFMPLLFLISIAAKVVHVLFGRSGLIALSVLALGLAIVFFPQSPSTGFSLGVGIWGLFSYCAGWLIHAHRDGRVLPVAMAAVAFLVLGVAGWDAWPKVFSLLLLIGAPLVSLQRIPMLVKLGLASATIFAYHTPFILQPLVQAASHLPSPGLRIAGALFAGLVSMLVCVVAYFYLSRTRLRVLLL